MDLLNEIALIYTADKAYTLAQYIEMWITDSGFEIGINESDSTTKKLAWNSEQTVTERLIDVAEQFGYEISFSFEIEKMAVTHKYEMCIRDRVGMGAVSKAVNTMSNHIGDAVSRYDQLNNFPKVRSNRGIESKASSAALKALDKGITGLPTTLDAATQAVSYTHLDVYKRQE